MRDYYKELATGWWSELVSTRQQLADERQRRIVVEEKLQEKERIRTAIIESAALRRKRQPLFKQRESRLGLLLGVSN